MTSKFYKLYETERGNKIELRMEGKLPSGYRVGAVLQLTKEAYETMPLYLKIAVWNQLEDEYLSRLQMMAA